MRRICRVKFYFVVGIQAKIPLLVTLMLFLPFLDLCRCIFGHLQLENVRSPDSKLSSPSQSNSQLLSKVMSIMWNRPVSKRTNICRSAEVFSTVSSSSWSLVSAIVGNNNSRLHKDVIVSYQVIDRWIAYKIPTNSTVLFSILYSLMHVAQTATVGCTKKSNASMKHTLKMCL